MTQRRVSPRATVERPAAHLVDTIAVADSLGPFPAALLTAWRVELDAVAARVTQRSALPVGVDVVDAVRAAAGVHAWVCLLAARAGTVWDAGQLLDAAVAIELAARAVALHERVIDASVRTDGVGAHRPNQAAVLGGDWAITQAANLVAGVGATAYQVLVRGYGRAQLGRLVGHADAGALLPTAWALGTLVGGAYPPAAAPPPAVAAWARAQLGSAAESDLVAPKSVG